MPRHSISRAFTLVEILVALTIVGFVMAGVMTLYVSTLKTNFASEEKLLINSDIRNLTERLLRDARGAKSVLLYKSFYSYTTANNVYPYTGIGADSTSVSYGGGGLTSGNELGSGAYGDYIVFVSYTDPFAGAQKISRIVAYWIAPNRNNQAETALYTFDSDNFPGGVAPWTDASGNPIAFPAAIASSNPVESLLPQNSSTWADVWTSWATNSNFQMVVGDIRGQSSQGLNFYNYAANTTTSTSILMHSWIIHGNAVKRLTDNYNLTITPRGG